MYFLLPIMVGCLIGILCGIIPGLHPNTVAIILSALLFSGKLSFFNPSDLLSFLIALMITNTFVDFIPSLIFSTPKDGTYLAVAPMQRYLKRGEGFLALIIVTISGLIALTILVIFSPFLGYFLKKLYPFLYTYTPDIIMVSILLFFLNSRNKKKTLLISLLASILGLEVFSLHVSSTEALSCMLTGLFGISSMLMGLFHKENIPMQNIDEVNVNMKDVLKGSLFSIPGGGFSSMLPGITATLSAIIISTFANMNETSFISLLGGINTANALMCLYVLAFFGKSRNGIMKTINEMRLNVNSIKLICFSAIISGIIGAFATLNIGKFMLRNISGLERKKIYIPALFLVFFIFLRLYGLFGILIMISSSLLGILCENMDVKKSTLAFSLLIPVLKTYLFM